MSVINEALADLKAIKEAANIAAKNRLISEKSERFESILKEEIQKRLSLKESMIEQQEDSIVGGSADSMKMNVDDIPSGGSDFSSDITEENIVDTEINESDVNTEDEEINIDELKEAMEELNIDDENVDSEKVVGEHDMNMNIKFDENGVEITDINVDGEEKDDIDIDIDSIDSNELDDLSPEDGDDLDFDLDSEEGSEEGDDLNFDFDSEDGSEEIDFDSEEGSEDNMETLEIDDTEDDEADVDFEDDDELKEEDFLDLDNELEGLSEDEFEEGLSHVMTHQNARQAGSEGNINTQKEKNLRFAVKESKEYKVLKAKANKLMKENKELVSLSKQYKDKVEKYKNQLFEMVFHNANLSHVNNLFVEHLTNLDEKIEIVNKFNNVQTIEESKKLYAELKKQLNENQKPKKTIEESVSGSSTVDNDILIKETTTYQDPQLAKMMRLINKLEGNA